MMTNRPERAVKRKQTRLSPIWIVPLLAVLIGLWMLFDQYASRGPVITLLMENAEGIEAGKTPVKSRNVQVGQVDAVRLSADFRHAIVEARMTEGTEGMLTSETRFWVVKPRIGREGISGLGTVLSGAYIHLLPGDGGEPQRRFEVLERPPIAPPTAEGLRLTLVSHAATSLRTGDPVTFQGFTVGRVEESRLDPESRETVHRVYIEKEYATLVTDTTRFWSASGVVLQLTSEGFTLELESLESLLAGGVTFDVPEEVVPGNPVKSGDTFTLYTDRESARQGTYERYLEYVLLVDGTTRGLSAGAPVEYRGIRVGTVVSVPWRFTTPDPTGAGRFAIPVLIHFEPQRFEDTGSNFDSEEWKQRLERMFARGLRATLKTGNYLTQALYVDLQFVDGAPEHSVASFHDKPVFPTTSGGLDQIGAQVSELLTKLNNLPLEPVLQGLETNLQTSQEALDEVRKASAAIQRLVSDPAIQGAPGALNDTLKELRAALESFSEDSPLYREITNTLQSLDAVLNDLQPAVRTLRERPSALIFDRSGDEDPQPRAPR